MKKLFSFVPQRKDRKIMSQNTVCAAHSILIQVRDTASTSDQPRHNPLLILLEWILLESTLRELRVINHEEEDCKHRGDPIMWHVAKDSSKLISLTSYFVDLPITINQIYN